MDEGYLGNLKVVVTDTLKNNNILEVIYEAKTHKKNHHKFDATFLSQLVSQFFKNNFGPRNYNKCRYLYSFSHN